MTQSAPGRWQTRIRLWNDYERIEKIADGLKAAADDEALRNLLRTPLQVLILTIIIDGSGHIAPDRYSLFFGYYDTVFKRERVKRGGLHQMLMRFGQEIQRLHEKVGFELQVRSELGARSFAALSLDELRRIAWQVLQDAGYDPSGSDSHLLDEIIRAATHRLVLIAPGVMTALASTCVHCRS